MLTYTIELPETVWCHYHLTTPHLRILIVKYVHDLIALGTKNNNWHHDFVPMLMCLHAKTVPASLKSELSKFLDQIFCDILRLQLALAETFSLDGRVLQGSSTFISW